MVLVKIGAIITFPGGGRNAGEPRELASICAVWICGSDFRRSDHFLYLYRLRFGFHRGRRSQKSAERYSFWNHCIADHLHGPLYWRGAGAAGDAEIQHLCHNADAASAPVAYALQQMGTSRFFQAVIVIGAMTGMISSLLVFQYGQTRIWFAMSRDGCSRNCSRTVSRSRPRTGQPGLLARQLVFPQVWSDISEAADLQTSERSLRLCWSRWVYCSFAKRDQTGREDSKCHGYRSSPSFPCAMRFIDGRLLVITWLRFFGWLAIGMVIYLAYSRRHSEFAPANVAAGKG